MVVHLLLIPWISYLAFLFCKENYSTENGF